MSKLPLLAGRLPFLPLLPLPREVLPLVRDEHLQLRLVVHGRGAAVPVHDAQPRDHTAVVALLGAAVEGPITKQEYGYVLKDLPF